MKAQIETAICNRLSSLDKYKALQQRRRRMSALAPVNGKGIALDFEERIVICKKKKKGITLLCKKIMLLF